MLHRKTYLFDFDGTLVDSMPSYTSAMLRILDEEGMAYHQDIIKIITYLGLRGTAEYFISIGVNRSKEENYQMAAQRLCQPVRRILFLDDNLNADKRAKEAGMPVCGVYDPSSEEYTEEIKFATDFYIENFAQLPAISIWE